MNYRSIEFTPKKGAIRKFMKEAASKKLMEDYV
jgi:hypothetical protein